ncbi:hypothetical protein [Corynebacterium anserum]|uniref:Uncharacterized protein n=1 Tax=Corynebacterium anserum TaxID=2684406 RepID=A0A7G7YPT0_9CORY|nr:hypothetical protein [Corynebacterium anserum]MBC2682144.1 hypothetical protein [Corynebacterium anserum]QNH96500.1 hypothetical protein GP473_07375 [Corynebacterium anserum]
MGISPMEMMSRAQDERKDFYTMNTAADSRSTGHAHNVAASAGDSRSFSEGSDALTAGSVSPSASSDSLTAGSVSPSAGSDSLTADLMGLNETTRQIHNVGTSLRKRKEPVEATLTCPLVPETTEFLRALSSARQAHSSALGSLASFFSDATSSLSQLSHDLEEHERDTAVSWSRWLS